MNETLNTPEHNDESHDVERDEHLTVEVPLEIRAGYNCSSRPVDVDEEFPIDI